MIEFYLCHSLSLSVGCFRISPEGVDIVLDCLCGENTGKGLSLLKPLGIYILYGRERKTAHTCSPHINV